jgi:hypothetical protein
MKKARLKKKKAAWRPVKRKEGVKVAKFSKYETPVAAPAPVKLNPIPAAVETTTDGCTTPVDNRVCGKPLAPGQTYVCADHIRRG